MNQQIGHDILQFLLSIPWEDEASVTGNRYMSPEGTSYTASSATSPASVMRAWNSGSTQ
jgi:hypothetical protein